MRAMPDTISAMAKNRVSRAETASGCDSVMAPAATSADILARLQKEIVGILRTNEIREKLAIDGAEIVASSPEEFNTFLRNETVKWAAVVKAAGIPQE